MHRVILMLRCNIAIENGKVLPAIQRFSAAVWTLTGS